MVRQVLPRDGVRLATHGENGLHRDVHDCQTLGTQTVRQDFERVGDEQTRPCERVAHTVDPDEGNLSVSSSGVGLAGVFVYRAGDGPANEGSQHALEMLAVQPCGIRDDEPVVAIRKSLRRPTLSIRVAA